MDPSRNSGDSANNQPASPNRRNSAGLFSSLMDQKRSENTANRRASLHDQRPQVGFLGQMWHNFTRGQPSNTK